MAEIAHFLDGLRCPTCTTLNAQWLIPPTGLLACQECGQTCLAVPEPRADVDDNAGERSGRRNAVGTRRASNASSAGDAAAPIAGGNR